MATTKDRTNADHVAASPQPMSPLPEVMAPLSLAVTLLATRATIGVAAPPSPLWPLQADGPSDQPGLASKPLVGLGDGPSPPAPCPARGADPAPGPLAAAHVPQAPRD